MAWSTASWTRVDLVDAELLVVAGQRPWKAILYVASAAGAELEPPPPPRPPPLDDDLLELEQAASASTPAVPTAAILIR